MPTVNVTAPTDPQRAILHKLAVATLLRGADREPIPWSVDEQRLAARVLLHYLGNVNAVRTPSRSDDPHDVAAPPLSARGAGGPQYEEPLPPRLRDTVPPFIMSRAVVTDRFAHLEYLGMVLHKLEVTLQTKDREYNASWKARGGVGAFMMLARKWDRLEPMVTAHGYDVFAMLRAHPDRIDDIRDLANYLLLVECEAIAQGWLPE